MRNTFDKNIMREIAIQIHNIEQVLLLEESGINKKYVLSDKFYQKMELLIDQKEKKQFRKKWVNM